MASVSLGMIWRVGGKRSSPFNTKLRQERGGGREEGGGGGGMRRGKGGGVSFKRYPGVCYDRIRCEAML